MSGEKSFFEDSSWIETLAAAEQTVFSLGHRRAQEVEKTLNKLVVDNQELSDETITEIIAELDATCGHMDVRGRASGVAYRRSLVRGTPEVDGTIPNRGVIEERKILDSEELISQGYIKVFNSEDTEQPYRIYHLMCDDPATLDDESVSLVEMRYAQHFYRLPIDGTADVQPLAPAKPSAEILELYAPNSLRAANDALARVADDTHVEEILSESLRQLGKANLLQDRIVIDDNIYGAALSERIDEMLGINKTGLHVMNHEGPAFICDKNNEYIGSVFLKKAYAFHGIVTGTHFVSIDGSENERLYLGFHTPTDTEEWHTLLIPLTDSLTIYPCNQLPISQLA